MTIEAEVSAGRRKLLSRSRAARARELLSSVIPIDLSDLHAGDHDRRARLQAARLVEQGVDGEAPRAAVGEAGDVEGKVRDRPQAREHEKTHQKIPQR